MAKSFYNIIKEGKIKVTHGQNNVTLDLPTWLQEAKDCLENEDGLVAWARSNGVMHGLLHAGIQQVIIQMRAAARPDENTNIIKDRNGAQERLDNYKCTPVRRPGTGSTQAEFNVHVKMAQAMADSGLDKDTIEEILAKNCDRIMIAKIMNAVEMD